MNCSLPRCALQRDCHLNRSEYQLDKDLVAASFAASSESYEESALVQQQISRQLLSLLAAGGKNTFPRVLEVGCCTGYLSSLFSEKLAVEKIYVNDIVEKFCKITSQRISCSVAAVTTLPGDIENCVLPDRLDLIISSATLQWITDLRVLLGRFARSMNVGGQLAFSIFSPGTMREIFSLTGRGLHYLDPRALEQLVAEKFIVEHFETVNHTLYFDSVRAIIRHIHKTGVGGVGSGKWSHRTFRQFEKDYERQYRVEQGLPVSYHSSFVIARVRSKGRETE